MSFSQADLTRKSINIESIPPYRFNFFIQQPPGASKLLPSIYTYTLAQQSRHCSQRQWWSLKSNNFRRNSTQNTAISYRTEHWNAIQPHTIPASVTSAQATLAVNDIAYQKRIADLEKGNADLLARLERSENRSPKVTSRPVAPNTMDTTNSLWEMFKLDSLSEQESTSLQ